MPDETNHILAIIEHPLTWLFGAGGMGTILGKWSERRKTAAEAKQVEATADATATGTALSVAVDMRGQLKLMWERLDVLDKKHRTLEKENFDLRERLSDISERFYRMSARVSKLLIINATLRAYIAQMTRRDGDPTIPPMLLEEIDEDDEMNEKVG